ncbi:MAG: AraC family transcriptional regulator [Syntrophomonadaceae bacterium]|nr:AraC family transcriptional regulator [Syntrophomonadaceae bacterium]MDD3024387.1 AraC family transcriptional regulator [Syntrophomonadaceae bacterium]
MKDISEKVSYLQGLSEGLNIREGSPQGKIISGILSVLDEMADGIKDIKEEYEELKDYMETIDDDLMELEEEWLSEDRSFIQTRCPKCGEQLHFESDILDDDDSIEIICPNCDEVVFVHEGCFDFEPSLDDDDIGSKVSVTENISPS